ncbi:MAG: Crp/Fnr family transcriptional regulator [Pseudomonadota bacterium]
MTLAAGMPHLSEQDREALRHLNVVHRFVGRGKALLREREPVTQLRVLCKGWTIRSRRLDQDRRQILDVALPGDLIGLHVDGMGESISDVTALTPCELGEIDPKALQRVADANPGIAAGLNRHMSRQIARANDQVMRLGRMTAYERVSSLLLDLYDRQRPMVLELGYVDFPITQTVAADMLGLSVVHVNRQVMRLRREGLVTLNRKRLVIHDEALLATVARYEDRQFTAKPKLSVVAAE